ncbi:hypothetical protein AB3N59_05610 [Leptospira sp. WS92.C1]
MKLFLFSILLFFASMGSSYNSLYASDVVVEADFELAESVEIQNSFLEPSSVFASAEAVAVAIDRASGSMSEDLDLSVSVWDRIVSRLDSFFSFLRSSDHLSKGLKEFQQISNLPLRESLMEFPQISNLPLRESSKEFPQISNLPLRESLMEFPQISNLPLRESLMEFPQISNLPLRESLMEFPQISNLPLRESLMEFPQISNLPLRESSKEFPQISNLPLRESLMEFPQISNLPLRESLMEFPQISGSALVARDDRSFALELDRIFLDSLQNASFVSDSIFAIVSSDFADSLKEVSLSNSANRSSLFAGFVVLDLFLPERTRKKLVPSIFRTSPLLSALFSSFLGNRLGIVSGPVLIFTHLSFHHSFLNRKLLRYYAIRSDGPPYLSFQQVCV